MFQTKFVVKVKTQILCWIIFSPVYEIICKKHSTAGQTVLYFYEYFLYESMNTYSGPYYCLRQISFKRRNVSTRLHCVTAQTTEIFTVTTTVTSNLTHIIHCDWHKNYPNTYFNWHTNQWIILTCHYIHILTTKGCYITHLLYYLWPWRREVIVLYM